MLVYNIDSFRHHVSRSPAILSAPTEAYPHVGNAGQLQISKSDAEHNSEDCLASCLYKQVLATMTPAMLSDAISLIVYGSAADAQNHANELCANIIKQGFASDVAARQYAIVK